MWLSVRIGIQRVEFKTHLGSGPQTIDDEAKLHHLKLTEFYFVEGECLKQSNSVDDDFDRLATIG